MDWTKFIILAIACISGFITTSYSSLAEQKGWPIGHLFVVERGSFIIIIGFICQVGSIVISFFVNPWWSAILVLIVGYAGYILLSSIFKKYSQIVGGLLVVFSFIIVPIFVFGKKSVKSENAVHLKQSINYANGAARISNSKNAFDTFGIKEMTSMIDNYRKALNTSQQVEINILNERLSGFGEHYQSEFINGLNLIIEGFDENNQQKSFKGQELLDNWGNWYSENLNRIKGE